MKTALRPEATTVHSAPVDASFARSPGLNASRVGRPASRCGRAPRSSRWPSHVRTYRPDFDLCSRRAVQLLAAAHIADSAYDCLSWDAGYCLDAADWVPAGFMTQATRTATCQGVAHRAQMNTGDRDAAPPQRAGGQRSQ